MSAKALLQLASWCREQQAASNLLASKDEQGGDSCQLQFPPARSNVPANQATTVPLERLWEKLPQDVRQPLLRQLSLMLAQRLALAKKEQADE